MMSEEDGDDGSLFRQAMADVNRSHKNYRHNKINPACRENRTSTAGPTTGSTIRPTTRPTIGDDRIRARLSIDSEIAIDETQTGESVLFSRSGLQRKVIRRLKRGEFPIQSILDLHGMRTFEALDALDEFLQEAIEAGENCVLIIHGKGSRSENKGGVLKPLTINRLKQVAAVKAFSSTLPKDGGTGAVYVLLKPRSR